jgi:hypothetical protein
LPGFIQNHIDERAIGFVIAAREDVSGDFNKERVEFAFVPAREDLVQLFGTLTEYSLQQRICFADELHVAIFDTVVHHLHIMTGTQGADIGAAWKIRVSHFHLRRNLGENWLNECISFGATARHNGRAMIARLSRHPAQTRRP